MIQRTNNIDIFLTPEELAFEFSNMDEKQQAVFFNELAKITEKWERQLCFQLQTITDSKILTPEARGVMRQIGEYADPSSS